MVRANSPSDNPDRRSKRQITADAICTAERNVVAAVAFNLADVDAHKLHPDLVADPKLKTILLALLAYRHSHPSDSMITASRLVQYMAQTIGVSQLLTDGEHFEHPNAVIAAEIAETLEIGWHSTKSIVSDVQVIRDAAFKRRGQQALADLYDLDADPLQFLSKAREAVDSLAQTAGLVATIKDTDPWTLPVDEDDPWPNPLSEVAMLGAAGEFVRIVGPQTESDAAALLFHVLVYFGAMAGRNRYFVVEAAQHYPQLFVTFIGQSAKGRKGTAQRNVGWLFSRVDGPEGTFICENIASGLSSGEGLIYAVRDPVVHGDEVTDPGVEDKRLLVIESEFASTLRVIRRETNTLSAVVRDAWDLGRLRTMTKNSPMRATGAHINIIGHTSREELRRLLTEIEHANGFANRFMWVCTRRSRLLPDGGRFDEQELEPVIHILRDAIQRANHPGRMVRTEHASKLWREVYPTLAADRAGMLGSATNRAEAQVLRLSLVFALIDCADVIDAKHLRAALECWRYCEDSARYVFGRSLGDAVAEELLSMLKAAPDGLSREQIRDAFHRNKSSAEIRRALGVLLRSGLAHGRKDHSTGGRPAEIWIATQNAENAVDAVTARTR